MKTGRLYVNWVVFMTWALLLFCTAGSIGAAPPNWIRSDEGLTLTSSSAYAPNLFSFDRWVYVDSDEGLYVQLYNNPCFGWQQVTVPPGSGSFKPLGDYLFATGGSDLWWVRLGDDATLPTWNKVSSTGLPTGAIISPQAIFNGHLYAWVVTTYGTFDIYRTPDIGKTSMAWNQVVSAGFGDPLNHELGCLIEYNNKLIAVTTNTRTDPMQSFGDYNYYGTGVEVWESPSGDAGTWVQVNVDGFGTETVIPDGAPITIRTNQDFGSVAVYSGYLYVGTKAHTWHSGEVWQYNGTGLGGWTNVTPEGMCSAGIGLGCLGPSRANAMIVYDNLLYLAEGVSTGNLEAFDGTTWTIVVAAEIDVLNNGHPFDAANRGISSLAVLPSRPTPSGGSTGDKLFALTTTLQGGAQIWSYPFSEMPLTCTALKQATISITPKTATSELFPGATHTFNVKVDAGTGFDFGQVFVPLDVCVSQSYYGGGGGVGCGQGWVSDNGIMTETYEADFSGPTPPLNPLYPDEIRACFWTSESSICDSATHTWVDTTPPVITITTPADGAKYILNQFVTADYVVQDAVGVVLITITPKVAVGGPIPTGQPGTQTFTVTAKDYSNNSAIQSVTYQVLTPAQGTQGLVSGVDNSPIPQGIKDGLNDKLNDAINALNQGDKKAAINILQAFINMVNAQRGKKITNAQADSWIAEAQKIINSINAS